MHYHTETFGPAWSHAWCMMQDADVTGCSLSCWNGSSLRQVRLADQRHVGLIQQEIHNEAVSAVNLRLNASAASNDWQWHIA